MIAIDTHIWIFLVTDQLEKISKSALRKIHQGNLLILSAISCWEVALLEKNGRLKLDRSVDNWIKNALLFPKLKVIDLTPDILVKSVQLKEFHADPADRMIVATSILNSLPLVTLDKKIQQYSLVMTIS